MIDKQRLSAEASARGIEISAEAAELADRYCEMVELTNRSFNLTAITDPDGMEEKNVLDCLTVLPWLPEKGRVADLGTGAGFPGAIIKLCRPELELTLIEATGKKLDFTSGALRSLGMDAAAVHMRGEEAARGELRESFDAVTARAVASLPVLLEYALPLVRPGGRLLAMKGAGADAEIAMSANALKVLGGEITAVHRYTLPTAGERAVIEIKKTASCPDAYPRPAGRIKKRPL